MFTDYYRELNLNEEDSIEEINRALNQLESIWKRREINNPEKATKMLALIIEARNNFRSDSCKKEYDNLLAESKKPKSQRDYDEEQKALFLQYRVQAENFFLDHQVDLALESVRRAQQYYNPSQQDTEFSYMCSLIKYETGDLQGALSDVTEAIVGNPNNATYYSWKAYILGCFFNTLISEPNGFQIARAYLAQSRSDYEKALVLAEESGDTDEQITCLKSLAESYAIVYDSDFDRAENYAKQAIDMGDTSPELQKILESIKQSKVDFQPYQGKNHPSSSSGGGCYIATAVYGSYDCPEVWTLRRYRDNILSRTILGRLFIKVYYVISPHIVDLLGNKKWFNRFWKYRLDMIVKKLQEKGVSSNRYSDWI